MQIVKHNDLHWQNKRFDNYLGNKYYFRFQ